MKLIPLTQGQFAQVDDEDYEDLIKYKWYAAKGNGENPIWYARRRNGNYGICMGQHLLNPSKGMQIDHKDGNGLNYQRYNIRVCTNQQNSINKHKHKSKYKGVRKIKGTERWDARIGYNYLHICLGRYDTEKEAALAYNNKAIELFGEFARLNEVEL